MSPAGIHHNQPVFTIKVAAELARVHPQTLRLYERKGLVRPARSRGRFRLYSLADVERLKLVQELTQEAGLNLEGVRRVLELKEEVDRLEEVLHAARGRMAELKSRLEAELADAKPGAGLVHIRRGTLAIFKSDEPCR